VPPDEPVDGSSALGDSLAYRLVLPAGVSAARCA